MFQVKYFFLLRCKNRSRSQPRVLTLGGPDPPLSCPSFNTLPNPTHPASPYPTMCFKAIVWAGGVLPPATSDAAAGGCFWTSRGRWGPGFGRAQTTFRCITFRFRTLGRLIWRRNTLGPVRLVCLFSPCFAPRFLPLWLPPPFFLALNPPPFCPRYFVCVTPPLSRWHIPGTLPGTFMQVHWPRHTTGVNGIPLEHCCVLDP